MKRRVLLVEDDASTAVAMATVLRPLYDVVPARDGVEALECARQLPQPDVIVTDVGMPNMSGVELADHLRDFGRTAHIPIIFLTTDGSGPALVAGLRAGAAFYLTKPVLIDELISSIEHAIRGLRPGSTS